MISSIDAVPSPLAPVPPDGYVCSGGTTQETVATVYAQVSDATDPPTSLVVRFTWHLDATGATGGDTMTLAGGQFQGQFSVSWAPGQENGGTITITVSARDATGNVAKQLATSIRLDPCDPFPILR
ncbi:MAG TPA: hypothetical protein VFM54_13850 [Micromonosporaceae bacterium]|nr:hypothetical protein [Micromonosporaceae bacterium]